MDIDPDTQLEALREALLSPTEKGWEVHAGRVVRYWQEANGRETADAKAEIVMETVSTEQVDEGLEQHSASDRDTTVVPRIPEAVPLKEKLAGFTSRIFGIERKIPDIRQSISGILDTVYEKNVAATLNGPQMQRIYGMGTNYVNQALERGYVTPEQGRDHHPVFNVEEVAILIFLKNNGNGLSPREIRELRRIIREQIAKRLRQ